MGLPAGAVGSFGQWGVGPGAQRPKAPVPWSRQAGCRGEAGRKAPAGNPEALGGSEGLDIWISMRTRGGRGSPRMARPGAAPSALWAPQSLLTGSPTQAPAKSHHVGQVHPDHGARQG